ncbi:polysaccharide pyruvyl transferase family protein [Nocardiopsis sp. NPDC006938]|uniref:polysaccharide pyruvyl transferase family protein n=1 Tax=Nocardiopsis sp. NPDC006938 TaxID=3364337 RepID=UPI0036C4FAB0
MAGWFSFLHGEATAGDVGAAEAVGAALRSAGIGHDVAWSPVFRPGGLSLNEAERRDYSALVFVCGPVSGEQVRDLHRRFPRCRRVAVGVSVVDPGDPAFLGFDTVLPRDGTGARPERDLAPGAPRRGRELPVVGVILAPGQPEYGARAAHDRVHHTLGAWLVSKDCARVSLDTRLDRADWRHCADPRQFDGLVRRTDLVVTTRLHGLALALRNGVPALAVDPVVHGAKVAAQGWAWDWPVLTVADHVRGPDPASLDRWWEWCLEEGRVEAGLRAADTVSPLGGRLVEVLRGEGTVLGGS